MDQLKVWDHVPQSLLTCKATELCALLGAPSLFYLKGMREPPLFLTVLQHGNEPTGFEAVQRLLRKYSQSGLPRSLWLFIANVRAAEQGLRSLPDQADFNRVWPGTGMEPRAETAVMAAVVEKVTQMPLFASVDLHNNTGKNPHYGCVNDLAPPFLQLATLFARTVVYFQHPVGVQSMALAPYCPAVTLECGKAGAEAALDHAEAFLEACLHMHHLPEGPVAPHDIHLLKTHAVVKVREEVPFQVGGEGAGLVFQPGLDQYNFSRIEEGGSIGTWTGGSACPLVVTDEMGGDITAELFQMDAGKIIAKRDIIPSMATENVDVIRQDCLFYVMEEVHLTGPHVT